MADKKVIEEDQKATVNAPEKESKPKAEEDLDIEKLQQRLFQVMENALVDSYFEDDSQQKVGEQITLQVLGSKVLPISSKKSDPTGINLFDGDTQV